MLRSRPRSSVAVRHSLFLDANVLFTAAHNPGGKAAFLFEAASRSAPPWQLLCSAYALEVARRNVAITRRGKVVALLSPASAGKAVPPLAPWARIRALNSAVCHFEAGESVVQESEFEAAR